jgi:hypothetical protein
MLKVSAEGLHKSLKMFEMDKSLWFPLFFPGNVIATKSPLLIFRAHNGHSETVDHFHVPQPNQIL